MGRVREVWIPEKNPGTITKRRGLDEGKVKMRCFHKPLLNGRYSIMGYPKTPLMSSSSVRAKMGHEGILTLLGSLDMYNIRESTEDRNPTSLAWMAS